MPKDEGIHTNHRIRPSEHALRIALRAAKAEGLDIKKLTITGSVIEIHFGEVEADQIEENDGGLKEW